VKFSGVNRVAFGAANNRAARTRFLEFDNREKDMKKGFDLLAVVLTCALFAGIAHGEDYACYGYAGSIKVDVPRARPARFMELL